MYVPENTQLKTCKLYTYENLLADKKPAFSDRQKGISATSFIITKSDKQSYCIIINNQSKLAGACITDSVPDSDILIRVPILGSVHWDYGSGSCSFGSGFQYANKKRVFLLYSKFFFL